MRRWYSRLQYFIIPAINSIFPAPISFYLIMEVWSTEIKHNLLTRNVIDVMLRLQRASKFNLFFFCFGVSSRRRRALYLQSFTLWTFIRTADWGETVVFAVFHRDITASVEKKWAAFIGLSHVWKSRVIYRNTKLCIFSTNVKSLLLYGSDSWRSTKATERS